MLVRSFIFYIRSFIVGKQQRFLINFLTIIQQGTRQWQVAFEILHTNFLDMFREKDIFRIQFSAQNKAIYKCIEDYMKTNCYVKLR